MWTVTGIDEKQVATVEKTIPRDPFSIDSTAPVSFKIDVDTETDHGSGATLSGTNGMTLLRHVKTLLGKTLRVRMDPRGVTEPLPLPADTKAAIDAFPTSDYTLQMFDIASVANSETAYFVTLPAKLVAVGDAWKLESDPAVAEAEAFVTEFKYVGESRHDGTVFDRFTTHVTPKQNGDRVLPPGSTQGVSVTKQIGAGDSYFDRTQKHFAKAKYRSEISSTSSAQTTSIVTVYTSDVTRKP